MSATLLDGQISWSLNRDKDGYRTYKIRHYVNTDDFLDGPQVVLNCPGLPAVGSVWDFDNDYDPWCYCTPETVVSIRQGVRDGNKTKFWTVDNIFTNIPGKRCQDQSIEDPLLEPMDISGSFVKYTTEAVFNHDGTRIKTSSHERITGPMVEFDANRPTVRIGQNVAILDLATFSQMVDTVNDATMWGLPARCIKLSNVSWQRKIYGTCGYYFNRVFDFDVRYDTFDRTVPDEGTKCLHGVFADGDDAGTAPDDWILKTINGSPPDPSNPSHFSRFQDRNGNLARVLLNGAGLPALVQLESGSDTGDPASITISYYGESNFFLLDIPADLEA